MRHISPALFDQRCIHTAHSDYRYKIHYLKYPILPLVTNPRVCVNNNAFGTDPLFFRITSACMPNLADLPAMKIAGYFGQGMNEIDVMPPFFAPM